MSIYLKIHYHRLRKKVEINLYHNPLLQQRLWFIDQLVTGKGLYHIPRAVRLSGELDTSALRKALNHMVRRHEILRTLIVSKEGVGTQLILNADTPFNLTELSVDTKAELDSYIAQESINPF